MMWVMPIFVGTILLLGAASVGMVGYARICLRCTAHSAARCPDACRYGAFALDTEACPRATTAMMVQFFATLCIYLLVGFMFYKMVATLGPILKELHDAETHSPAGQVSQSEFEERVMPKATELLFSLLCVYCLLLPLSIFQSVWWIYGLTVFFGTPESSAGDCAAQVRGH